MDRSPHGNQHMRIHMEEKIKKRFILSVILLIPIILYENPSNTL